MKVSYRSKEAMFICPSASKIMVIFLVDFEDVTGTYLWNNYTDEYILKPNVLDL